MNNPKREFFFVWRPNGRSPTYRHPDLQSARLEAERLARLHKGEIFVVLRSIGEVCAHDVQWTQHADAIPF